MIKSNLLEVHENMKKACEKAGRSEQDVELIAVSKTKPVSALMEAYESGCRIFGENKVQELVDKYEVMPKDIKWHMIGHLQRNKVKYVVDKAYLIHGVDSLKLAEEISKESMKRNITAHILIEVNMAKEETKFGVPEAEAEALVKEISLLPSIQIEGLMIIALRQLSVDIKEKNIDNVNMNALSMGMTGDYTVAVEEGATYVRVGTGIFGERHYETV